MIFELQIKDYNHLSPEKFKYFKWVKKRKDLISIFAFSSSEKNKVLKKVIGRFNYKEFELTKFNEIIPKSDDFVFDGFTFTNKKCVGSKIITLNTQRSFGFDHPATVLTLKMLSFYTSHYQNKRVLDIGCGSGILSIYMLKKGCKKACGVDIDPFIVDEAIRNARANGFNKRQMNVMLKDLSRLKKGYSFVVANVPMNVHMLIADEVKRLLNYSGIFVAGGFFNSNFEDIVRLYKGLCLIELKRDADWAVAAFENK